MDINTFFEKEVQKLHDTETQLAEGLSFLASHAQSDDLREALLDHRQETLEHIRRIEQICNQIGCSPTGEQDKLVRTLVSEAQTMFSNAPMSSITDACIIAAAQKSEHLEMAAYGTACALADEMDKDDVKDLLGKTLDEEKDADKKLSKLAEHGINQQAVEASVSVR